MSQPKETTRAQDRIPCTIEGVDRRDLRGRGVGRRDVPQDRTPQAVAGSVHLGTVDVADALFVLDAVKRHPGVGAFPDVLAHLELMVAIADRAWETNLVANAVSTFDVSMGP